MEITQSLTFSHLHSTPPFAVLCLVEAKTEGIDPYLLFERDERCWKSGCHEESQVDKDQHRKLPVGEGGVLDGMSGGKTNKRKQQ